MRATAYISTVVGQAETGTGAWQHVTASGTTPPGTASISVYIGDPSGVAQTIYVDDVNLQTAAPTPIDVLANDTNPDGGPKQIDSVTQPAHGTVAITGGGTGLTYQPNANYCNDGNPTDDFTYTLNGGSTRDRGGERHLRHPAGRGQRHQDGDRGLRPGTAHQPRL